MYKKNDILVHRDGYKRKVLEVVGSLCALSDYNNHAVCGDWYTPEELDVRGYTLDSSEWEPEEGEAYWSVSLGYKEVFASDWTNHKIDNNRKQLNLVFKTKELAEKRLAEVITLLKQ